MQFLPSSHSLHSPRVPESLSQSTLHTFLHPTTGSGESSGRPTIAFPFGAYRGRLLDLQESRTIAGKTARCRCNFITVSCGFAATARLSCWSLSADCMQTMLAFSPKKSVETTKKIIVVNNSTVVWRSLPDKPPRISAYRLPYISRN